MKLGLITDIHEQVDKLEWALHRLDKERVDQVIAIGDVFETGERIEETCRLLEDAGVIGVWGNHDFGLCTDSCDDTRSKYSERVAGYMHSLKALITIAGCVFQHNEPWLDPADPVDLWYFGGPPSTPEMLNRIFEVMPGRVMFAGHYHQWLLATPELITNWSGERTIQLAPPAPYFVVIGALCEGRFATLDTETWKLRPFDIGR